MFQETIGYHKNIKGTRIANSSIKPHHLPALYAHLAVIFMKLSFCCSSHSRGGSELHNLPISGADGRSLIVIHGLTFYNKV